MKFAATKIASGLCFLLLSLQVEGIMADENGYQLPPQEVVDIIDAKPEPIVSFSPDANWMLLIDRDAMPDIADISRRMLELAGKRIDPLPTAGFLPAIIMASSCVNRMCWTAKRRSGSSRYRSAPRPKYRTSAGPTIRNHSRIRSSRIKGNNSGSSLSTTARTQECSPTG